LNSSGSLDYRTLAEFRYRIRRFLRFSEEAARDAGLEPQQHQLLLSVRGLPAGVEPTVGELAERLQIRHHSVVELIDRLEERGLVVRRRSERDRRRVLIDLAPQGERVLEALIFRHHAELESEAPELLRVLNALLAR
jgi:DNA-binding MarR family transcriptional regulator